MKKTKQSRSVDVPAKQRPKVVFTFVEAGYGHIAPANGMAEAFERKYGKYCDIVRWYIYRDSESSTVRSYGRALARDTKLLHRSPLYARLQHAGSVMSGQRGSLFFVDAANAVAKHKVIKAIVDMNPDMLVATYFSPAHFALEARRHGLLDCIVAQYSPDPYIYNVWDRRISGDDLYIVNNDMAYKHCLSTGYKAEFVKQVPFVTTKRLPTESKQQLRERLGLPVDKLTVVLADGVYALGKHYKCTKALACSNLPITVVSVCGKNEDMLQKLQKLKVSPNVTFVPLGFCKNMDDYIACADLFVGKGGSNTICECMMLGTPMIIDHYGGMLEKITADYYAGECGCALQITDIHKIVEFLQQVIDNPHILDKYKQASLPYRRDDGADIVADVLFEQLKRRFPNLGKE